MFFSTIIYLNGLVFVYCCYVLVWIINNMVILFICKFVFYFYIKWLNFFDFFLEFDLIVIIVVGSILFEIFLDVIFICKIYLDVIFG